MEWIFKPRGDEKVRNPMGEEFFNSPELLSESTSLVRESIQNSLDAQVDKDESVRVRFKIGRISNSDQIERNFNSLEAHTLEVLGANWGTITQECRFLVYEDFNTEGLRGDSRLNDIPSGEDKGNSNYTYFVHKEGEGNKSSGKRGKWGVGKVVFPMLSRVKTFFAYSVREEEYAPCGKKEVFIGQSILKFHQLDGQSFQPDGWFAEDASGVAVPFSGRQAEDLAQQWSVSRLAEPGLSVIVPYISEDLSIHEIRDSVLREYFISIVSGDLVCELESESGEIQTLDSQSIGPLLEEIEELSAGTVRDLDSRQIKSAIFAFNKAKNVNAIDFSLDDEISPATKYPIPEEILLQVSESIADAGVALVIARLGVPKAQTLGVDFDTFEILIASDPNQTNPVIFSREGILIPGRKLNLKEFMTIVMVDEGDLADMLGSSEGPAHEEWSKDTKKFKSTYGTNSQQLSRAVRAMSLVRNLPRRFEQELTKTSDSENDETFFAGWFDYSADKKPKPEVPPRVEPDAPVLPPLKRNPTFAITSSGGVAKVSRGESLGAKGDFVVIELAYATFKGNAFKKWSPFDFQVEDKKSLRINCDGLKVRQSSGNSLRLEIVKEQNWSVSLSGFDTYRDLELKANLELGDEGKKS
jgi:hypothetical protein